MNKFDSINSPQYQKILRHIYKKYELADSDVKPIDRIYDVNNCYIYLTTFNIFLGYSLADNRDITKILSQKELASCYALFKFINDNFANSVNDLGIINSGVICLSKSSPYILIGRHDILDYDKRN